MISGLDRYKNLECILYFFLGGGEKLTEFLLLYLNYFIHLGKIPGVDKWLISPYNEKFFNEDYFAGTVA